MEHAWRLPIERRTATYQADTAPGTIRSYRGLCFAYCLDPDDSFDAIFDVCVDFLELGDSGIVTLP